MQYLTALKYKALLRHINKRYIGSLVMRSVYLQIGSRLKPNAIFVVGTIKDKCLYFYNLANDSNATHIQTNDYTPFGLAISSDVSKNKYLYNAQELQDGTNWLDYGARMYYPELGRWMAVDPLTDEQEAWNPYHYTYNNPSNYVDLFGLNPTTLAKCPTCHDDPKYDPYRDSKSLYTYDKETGIVLNGDGKGVTVYGKRNNGEYNQTDEHYWSMKFRSV